MDASLSVLDALPAGIVVLDSAGRVVVVNAAFRRIASLLAEGSPFRQACVIGCDYLALTRSIDGSPGFSPVVADGLADVLRGRETIFRHVFDCELVSPSIHFALEATPTSAGGILVAYHDVTRQHLLELALRASEERFRAVVEDQTEVISRFTGDGSYIFVNEVYCRFFGKSEDELLGRQWHPVAHPDDLPVINAQLARLTPENPVVTIENRVRSAKGEMRWMQFVNRATFDRAGRLVEVQSVGRDITDQRRVADELLRSEAHMRLAMSAAPLGTWEWDLVTDEVHWSDNLWRMFGLEPGQGKLDLETFREAIHPGDRFRVMRAIESVLGAGQGCCVEFRVVCPDGTLRWALAHGKAELDARGQPRRIFGVNMDISGLKEANEALDQSRLQLQALLAGTESVREEERKAIAADIHDQLGAALTAAVFGLNGLSAHVDAVGASALTDLRRIILEASHTAREICTRLRPPMLDDLGLIETCRWYSGEWSRTTGIRVVTRFARLDSELEEVLRVDLFRILQELLTNVARHASANRVNIVLSAKGGGVTLTVSDDGHGFSKSHHGGLGLAGIHERARRHGGDICIDPGPPGARIRARIPAKGQEAR